MKALRLFAQLSAYYLLIGLAVFVAMKLFPHARDYLPIGGVEELINQPQKAGANGLTGVQVQQGGHVDSLGDSLFWLTTALIGAFLTSLPVSWIYMSIRNADEYDQSLISTIIILPLVVTGIVIIVQNSLALAFSLARNCRRGALQEFAQKLGRRALHPAVGRHRPVRRDRRGRARGGDVDRLQLLASSSCGSPNMASARG